MEVVPVTATIEDGFIHANSLSYQQHKFHFLSFGREHLLSLTTIFQSWIVADPYSTSLN